MKTILTSGLTTTAAIRDKGKHMKSLIVAEKPNVAKEIAAALKVPASKGYFENDRYIISNCFGHLMDMYAPEAEEKGASLPIIPSHFSFRPKEEAENQYGLLVGLINRNDVGLIINACDAEREGENIFRWVFDSTKSQKPVKRMWINSTTVQGYLDALENAKDQAEFNHLAAAARSRAEADWLFGINGTRAIRNAMGRVMTPTLAMVVDAYRANKNFRPEIYWEVDALFSVAAGTYSARLLAPDGKTAKFKDRAAAIAALDVARTAPFFSVEDEVKAANTAAPFLFDGTELQKVANQKFKYSADRTLEIMQSLYEKYKALTYPRTDMNALPEDFLPTISTTIGNMGKLAEYGKIVEDLKQKNLLTSSNKRVFDNNRVAAHYAVIPTGSIKTANGEKPLSSLSENDLKAILPPDEYNIFHLVALRTLAAFYPPAEYMVTTRTTAANGSVFKTSGRVLKKQGWLAVYGGQEPTDGGKADKEAMQAIPRIEPDETAKLADISLKDLKTKAPPLMTEGALIQAMKTAGRDIEDEHLSTLMKQVKGIGTSATRAPTIAKLKKATAKKPPYMELVKNHLIPTERGMAVIDLIRKSYPQAADPIFTAEWEDKLLQIEQGKLQRTAFMKEIKAAVSESTILLKQTASAMAAANAPTLCACPSCKNGKLKEAMYSWSCDNEDCGFRLQKSVAKKNLPNTLLKQLAETGKTPIIEGFLGKSGKTFKAALMLIKDEESKGGLKIGFDLPQIKEIETKYLCPCCQKHNLTDKGRLISCPECDFTLWKSIAGKQLQTEEIDKLLKTGRTLPIKGFIAKSGRTFTAKLLLNPTEKKIEFELVRNKR